MDDTGEVSIGVSENVVKQFIVKKWSERQETLKQRVNYEYPLVHWIFYVLVTPFARIPFIVAPLILVFIFLTSVITVMNFPGLGDMGSFSAREDYVSQRQDAYMSLTSERLGAVREVYNRGEVSIPGIGVLIYYEVPDGNIFQYNILRRIQEIEQTIYSSNNMSDFCFVPYYSGFQIFPGSGCMEPMSVIGALTHNKSIYGDLPMDLNSTLHEWAVYLDTTHQDKRFFLDQRFSLDYLKTEVTRTMIMFGFPLKNFPRPGNQQADVWTTSADFSWDNASLLDEEQLFIAQYTIFTEWAKTAITEYLKELYDGGLSYGGNEMFNLFYIAPFAIMDEVMGAIMNDLMWMSLSFLVVFIIISLQTKSVILTLTGTLHIVSSYPLAFFVYSLFYSIYPMMNWLGAFIILGIGADDIFVTVDAWKQSWLTDEKYTVDSHHQLAWVYRRAVTTMFITTLTTFMSFVATALSVIPSIKVFGVFTALIVLFNYLLVITWYPSVIMMWTHLVERRSMVRGCKSKSNLEISDMTPEMLEAINNLDHDDEFDVSLYRLVERWFYAVHGSAIYKLRWLVYTFFILWLCFCAYMLVDVSQLSIFEAIDFSDDYADIWESIVELKYYKLLSLKNPASETMPLPEDGNLAKSIKLTDKMLPTSGYSALFFLFGVNPDDPIDRMDFDPNDGNNLGFPNYDTNFNITIAESQLSLKRICEDLMLDNVHIIQLNFSCWILDFEAWTNKTYSMVLPIPSSSLYGLIFAWMGTNDFNLDYLQNLGWKRLDDGISYEMIWTSLAIPAKNIQWGSSNDLLMAEFDYFEDVMVVQNALSPLQFQGYQTSTWWVWMRTTDLLTSQALSSVIISAIIAYICLLGSTMNVLLSTFAIVAIITVVLTLVTIMILSDWYLGIVESINITIIVGLSIDYVVHLANSYMENHAKRRKGRTKVALLYMGVSVLGGMITSCGATIWLFCTQISFFKFFGIMIFLTIAVSYVVSTMFFISICYIIGPNYNQGDLKQIFIVTFSIIYKSINYLVMKYAGFDLSDFFRKAMKKFIRDPLYRVFYLDFDGSVLKETNNEMAAAEISAENIKELDEIPPPLDDLEPIPDDVGKPIPETGETKRKLTASSLSGSELSISEIPAISVTDPPPPIVAPPDSASSHLSSSSGNESGPDDMKQVHGFDGDLVKPIAVSDEDSDSDEEIPPIPEAFDDTVPLPELDTPSGVAGEERDLPPVLSSSDYGSSSGDDEPPPAIPPFAIASSSSDED